MLQTPSHLHVNASLRENRHRILLFFLLFVLLRVLDFTPPFICCYISPIFYIFSLAAILAGNVCNCSFTNSVLRNGWDDLSPNKYWLVIIFRLYDMEIACSGYFSDEIFLNPFGNQIRLYPELHIEKHPVIQVDRKFAKQTWLIFCARVQGMKDLAFKILSSPKSMKKIEIQESDTGGEPHKVLLCERCIEEGFPCPGWCNIVTGQSNTTPALRLPFNVLRRRKNRLAQENRIRILYYQTDEASAESILESQTLQRGILGMAGPAIYFAETPKATDLIAQELGVILECVVHLGRTKQLGSVGEPNLTAKKMIETEFDSATFRVKKTVAYAVYFTDQIKGIQKYKHKGK